MSDHAAYAFDRSALDRPRRAGISAIMRIRNGAAFLRSTIESHLPYYDEIVACFCRKCATAGDDRAFERPDARGEHGSEYPLQLPWRVPLALERTQTRGVGNILAQEDRDGTRLMRRGDEKRVNVKRPRRQRSTSAHGGRAQACSRC